MWHGRRVTQNRSCEPRQLWVRRIMFVANTECLWEWLSCLHLIQVITSIDNGVSCVESYHFSVSRSYVDWDQGVCVLCVICVVCVCVCEFVCVWYICVLVWLCVGDVLVWMCGVFIICWYVCVVYVVCLSGILPPSAQLLSVHSHLSL